MPEDERKKEPAPKPAPFKIPPFSQIIAEGDEEIARRVRALVESTVTSGAAIDLQSLRKLGPAGTHSFFKLLRERIQREIKAGAVARTPKPLPGTPVVDRPKSTKETAAAASNAATPAAKKAKSKRRKGSAVTLEKNWTDKQRHQWLFTTRATAWGLILAVMLTITAMILFRLFV
jgi:hypothetical protein